MAVETPPMRSPIRYAALLVLLLASMANAAETQIQYLSGLPKGVQGPHQPVLRKVAGTVRPRTAGDFRPFLNT